MTALERVQALQLRYVDTIDNGHFEEWPEFFTEQCHYRITHQRDYRAGRLHGAIYADSRAMLHDRVASLRDVNIYEAQSYRHIINPPLSMEPGDWGLTRWQAPPGIDVAYVRTGFIVARIMQDGSTDLFATGCYLDCVDLSTAAARFREKIVVLDSAVIDTLLALPI